MSSARATARSWALALLLGACQAAPACGPGPLADWRAWDAATPADRLAAARAVPRQAPDFAFARMETFACGGVRHEIAVFRHAPTGLEFSLVAPGTFDMGSAPEEAAAASSETRHRVTLTRPFLVARTETTRAAWRAVMGRDADGSADALDRPATGMSWFDASEFCRRARLELPTEAQWEWACRGGTTTRWCCGDDVAELGRYAWFGESGAAAAHPVGVKAPNAFGLFDVHGNVMEWCADRYGPYPPRAVVDPVGDPSSPARVHRGGSVRTPAEYATSAFHSSFRWPDTGHSRLGFRPVRTISP